MTETAGFQLHLFGCDFLIETDEPELVKTCLEASYGAIYRRGGGETGSVFFRLILQHRPPEAINNETMQGVPIPLEGGASGNLLIRNRIGGAGFTKLPPASDPGALRLVFAALAAFVHSALKERGIFFIHAAAVEWNGGAVLIAGPNGCGKSSLARALSTRGAGYLSDDAAPVNVGSAKFEILPSPEVISAAGLNRDEVQQLISFGFTPGPDPRFLMPPAGREAVPVSAIFFPEFGERPAGPVSLTKKEALLKILKLNKTPLADGEYEDWFQTAAELAKQAESARIVIRPGSPFPIEKVIEFRGSF